MPSLASHQSNDLVKLLLLGDAKSGKTGSLVSLVAAGYKLRILDFDNLLDILAGLIKEQCPDLIGNVEYISLRDKYKASTNGTILDGRPKAWIDSLKILNRWAPDGGTDLGSPSDWGSDCILVIDSLSRWCDAAYNFHEAASPPGNDGRAIYGNAQDDVEKQLATLTSPSFNTNVIVICHSQYMTTSDGSTKIFPQGVGQKLSPKIPQYFPTYVRYRNKAGKREIQLASDSMIDLANPKPAALGSAPLSIETGLAQIFSILRAAPARIEEVPRTKVPLTLAKRTV